MGNIVRAEDLTTEHFGKKVRYVDTSKLFFHQDKSYEGELTSVANEVPYFWTRHSEKPYKIYRANNREESEECWFEDCNNPSCWDSTPGPLVIVELDYDEMLELEPYDELEIID